MHVHIGAVGTAVTFRVAGTTWLVGCAGTGSGDTLGTLSLCHPATAEIRCCTAPERSRIRSSIVCRGHAHAGQLPVFRHERIVGETWWQMVVDQLPSEAAIAALTQPDVNAAI